MGRQPRCFACLLGLRTLVPGEPCHARERRSRRWSQQLGLELGVGVERGSQPPQDTWLQPLATRCCSSEPGAREPACPGGLPGCRTAVPFSALHPLHQRLPWEVASPVSAEPVVPVQVHHQAPGGAGRPVRPDSPRQRRQRGAVPVWGGRPGHPQDTVPAAQAVPLPRQQL